VPKNVGSLDSWVRAGLAIGCLVLAAAFNEVPALSLVAAAVGIVLMGTALTGHCPLYRAFGIDTHRSKLQHH